MTRVIGLTGGIGSGKSVVSRLLAELGAVIIDADELGHKAYQPNTQVWCDVVAAFGKQVVASDGLIDREKLGEIVFSSPEARARLNQIMHPRIHDMVKARLEKYRQQGAGVVVLEAPLLVEAGWVSLVDEVWVTAASETTVLKRLQERSGLSESESLARMHSQLPCEDRISHADVIIDTDCPFDELKAKVKELWQNLQTGV